MIHKNGCHDEPPKPLVALVMPTYGLVPPGVMQAYDFFPTKGHCEVIRIHSGSSFLTKTFNRLLAATLNVRKMGVTHWCMQHSDLEPYGHGWLDVLMAEMQLHEADAICAVAAIKDEKGLTSIAVHDSLDDPWHPRRLTLREVYELPETFGAADVGGHLLLNTGLFLMDLRRPWWDDVADNGELPFCFDFKNRIVYRPEDDEYAAEAISEDWLFSQELNRRGCKLVATRKVITTHHGEATYRTDRAWGTWSHDEAHAKVTQILKERESHASQVPPGLHGETGRPQLPQGAGV